MTESRAILLTGCSSGIGYTCAHGLKVRGWQVIASCRRQVDVDRLRGEGLRCVLIDYEDEASIHAGFEEALNLTEGRLDALFNNGAYAIPGMTEDLPTDALRQIFEANVFGWHTLTCRAVPVMREAGWGRIVQCSSVLGFAALKGRGAYNTTKFALEGLTDTLRVELHGTGIHVVLIEPGPIATKFRENARPQFEKWIAPIVEHSPWEDFYETTVKPRLYDPDDRKDRFELGPEAVLRKLVHAIESERPRPRYYVTTPTHVVGALKRVLPTRWFDAVLRRGS